VSSGSETCLPVKVGFHEPLCVQQYRILPFSSVGLQDYHVSSGFGSHLPVKVSFDIVTCPLALNPRGGLWSAACPASLLGGPRAATRPACKACAARLVCF
jgi:hypothetical protein